MPILNNGNFSMNQSDWKIQSKAEKTDEMKCAGPTKS